MNNYLEHRDHKYIKKIGSGNNARYFYSQAELDAYNALKKLGGKVASSKLGRKVATAVSPISKAALKAVDKKVMAPRRQSAIRYRKEREARRPIKRQNAADTRWAINSAKKPKAMPTAKVVQAGRNLKAKASNTFSRQNVNSTINKAKKRLKKNYNKAKNFINRLIYG